MASSQVRAHVAWMSSPVRGILEEIEKLSEKQRALVRAELGSFDEESRGDVEGNWGEVVARRVKGIVDGTAVLHADDEVEESVRGILKR